jgi:hypothetical protein
MEETRMKRLPVFAAGLSLVLALLPLAGLRADSGSWNGWITDDLCGAKGAKASHADCARKCLAKGASLVLYNEADQKLYRLDKQDVAKANIGYEVTVKGDLQGDTIHVASIAATAPAK